MITRRRLVEGAVLGLALPASLRFAFAEDVKPAEAPAKAPDAPATPPEAPQAKADPKAEDLLKPGALPEIVMGKADAPITIVEYHSMTCPHCANFHTKVLPYLNEKYIEPGKVRLILRGFPLNQIDAVAFMLLRCAPEINYLKNVKLFYETQRDWAYSDKPAEAIPRLAEQVGFTQDSFKACLQNQTIFDGLIGVARTAAEDFKVDATPSFFINGARQGAISSTDELEAKLAPFLKS